MSEREDAVAEVTADYVATLREEYEAEQHRSRVENWARAAGQVISAVSHVTHHG